MKSITSKIKKEKASIIAILFVALILLVGSLTNHDGANLPDTTNTLGAQAYQVSIF